MAKKRARRPQPLAPPPQSTAFRSRKRARVTTTLFHKYTRERDAAVARAREGGCHVACAGDDETALCALRTGNQGPDGGASPRQIALLDEVKKWEDKISEMGGREAYQKASQLNTQLFSTSKWVLGILGRWGWLDGMKDQSGIGSKSPGKGTHLSENVKRMKGEKERFPRRNIRLLEVGAINTQLLDAASRTRTRKTHISDPVSEHDKDKTCTNQTDRVHRLDVTAIDVRSTDPRIKQLDFFDLPIPEHDQQTSDSIPGKKTLAEPQPYDVIVNSMVINCLTTPAQRGRMLSLCYRHLRPGGVCFLVLPKLCLMQSKFMSRSYFEEILTKGVGFEILPEVGRESPKVAFFVLRRPEDGDDCSRKVTRRQDEKFAQMPVIHRGKKFRNTFSVVLNKEESSGQPAVSVK